MYGTLAYPNKTHIAPNITTQTLVLHQNTYTP